MFARGHHYNVVETREAERFVQVEQYNSGSGAILILTYFVSFEMYHIFYLLNVFGLDKHSVMHDYIANLGSFLLEFSYWGRTS